MDAGEYVPDEVTKRDGARPARRSPTPSRASCSTASRAPCRRSRSRRDARGPRGSARPGARDPVDDDEIVQRLSGRRVCPNGHVWHVDFNPPAADGVCDVDGGPLFQRADDSRDGAPPAARLRPRDRAADRVLPRLRPARVESTAMARSTRSPSVRSPPSAARTDASSWASATRLEIKTPEQIAKMRRAGLVVGETLELLRAAAVPGVTTARAGRARRGSHPLPRCDAELPGLPRPFPATICASVNDEVVHGIPGDRALQAEGDLISIDCGAIVDGWHGDAAITVAVGGPDAVSAEVLELMRVTEESMWAGIAAARLGGHVTDISHAIESYVPLAGRLRDHRGLRRPRHRHRRCTWPPNVPNYGRPGRGPKLVPGLALAVEPMVTLGGPSRPPSSRTTGRS